MQKVKIKNVDKFFCLSLSSLVQIKLVEKFREFHLHHLQVCRAISELTRKLFFLEIR